MYIADGQKNECKLFANQRTSHWQVLRSFEQSTSIFESLNSITNDINFEEHVNTFGIFESSTLCQ